MCSPGQHNEALSRTTWFECTSDEKGGKDVQPHMHLLTTSYFHSHEWGPHTDSPYCCQTVQAKTFHNTSSTQCSEKLCLGFAPSRTLGEDMVCLRGCKSIERFRGRAVEKERWFSFLRNLESYVILPSALHVVCSSFYTMFAQLSTAKLLLLLLCFWWTFRNGCGLDGDGDWISHQFGFA